ncbi:MAG: NTP transferase domain-containing protein [Opitutaceae bacterium]
MNSSFSLPRIVILAAGQGSRLGSLAAGGPKCLMPVGGEALLVRTLRQLLTQGFNDIAVVVGYQAASVSKAVQAVSTEIRCVENPQYATDTNIRSLLLGLENSDSAALIIEADIAFDDAAIEVMSTTARGTNSAWFTNGLFNPGQFGGILRADAHRRLLDLRYVPAYDARFVAYHKLIGAVFAGAGETPTFRQLMRTAAAETTGQYYMMPWCDHLSVLPAIAVDLAHCRTATFNTPTDYWRCEALFAPSRPVAV